MAKVIRQKQINWSRLLVFTVIFACFCGAHGFGAIAHSSTTTGGITGTQLDITHTISGTDRFVFVAVHQANGFPAISSVVWDPTGVNEALTPVGAPATNASDVQTTLFSRVNSTAITDGTMRITIASSDQLFAAVSSYTGVHQTTPLGTPNTNTGTGGSSVTVTAVVGDLVFDASGTKESGGAVVDPSQTQRWNGSHASEPFGWGATEVAATTSVVMNSTGSTEEFATVGVALKAAPAGDTTPPTPEPMTFATAPDEVDTTSIDMTATTASDPSTPVEYLFTLDNTDCGADAGTGGDSSLWQTGTSYTDTGLQVNQCYGYTVTARDSVPNAGTASSSSEAYTAAAVPGTPTLNGATTTTLDLASFANGNPASNPDTTYAVQVVTTSPNDATWLNQWVDAAGNPSATEVWMTDAAVDALTLLGLNSSTTYGVKARNGDGDETVLSVEGQGTTSAEAPTTRTVAIYPSTASSPGGYDATYTSMSAMQAGESKDLVDLNRFLRVEIVNSDGNWSTPDTSVIFDGWNTDRSAGRYLEIEVMSGARNPYTDGKWSTSHYRLSSAADTLDIDNDAAAGTYLEADFIGLQVENTGGNLAARIRAAAYHKTIKFIASHFRGTADFEVLQLSDDGTAEVWFINTILENSNISNTDEIVRATFAWSATAYFYNCTVVGGGLEGLDVDTGTVTVKNCAVFNNDGTDILPGGVTDFNASDDSVGTNWVDISPAAEVDGWNAAVTDYANGDYRVKDASSVLYQAGLSQTADSNVPSEDIAGNVRPTGSNPVSIGAFEATPPDLQQVHYRWRNDDGGEAGPGWYNTAWTYRKKITVDFTEVDADQTAFPVYVDLADLGADFFANVESSGGDDGGDIRVTTSNGTTELPRQVVSINVGSETGELHFEANFLSSTVNTDFYIYYGNAAASEPAASALYGSENVWANGYEAVWHLEEASGNFFDATSNAITGTDNVSHTGKSGNVGAGQEFDGNDDYISTGNIDFSTTDAISLSFWMNKASFDPASTQTQFELTTDTNSHTDGFAMHLDDVSTCAGTEIELHARGNDAPPNNNQCFASPSVAVWHHYVGIYHKGTSNPETSLYIDGASQTATGNPYTADNTNNFGLRPFYMGSRNGTTLFSDGNIDEVRLSNGVRPASWIKTEFNNQDNPGTGAGGFLATIGGQEAQWFDSAWGYRKKITIDNTKVDADQTDFPVYVDLADLGADFHSNVKSLGEDIRVTRADGVTELPRQVVVIDTGANTGELHFEANFLSSTVNTDFYIYYGNAAASEPAASAIYGSEKVWENGYAGMWHLKEDQAGIGNPNLYQDSTSNPNDGDDQISATGQGGQVSAGQEFDGTDDYVDAGTDASLDMGSGDFTLSAWIQTTATDSPVIAGKGGDGALGVRCIPSAKVGHIGPRVKRELEGLRG